jgi:hypothetical protein
VKENESIYSMCVVDECSVWIGGMTDLFRVNLKVLSSSRMDDRHRTATEACDRACMRNVTDVGDDALESA